MPPSGGQLKREEVRDEPRSVVQAIGLPQTRQPNCYSGKPATPNKKTLPYGDKGIVGLLRA